MRQSSQCPSFNLRMQNWVNKQETAILICQSLRYRVPMHIRFHDRPGPLSKFHLFISCTCRRMSLQCCQYSFHPTRSLPILRLFGQVRTSTYPIYFCSGCSLFQVYSLVAKSLVATSLVATRQEVSMPFSSTASTNSSVAISSFGWTAWTSSWTAQTSSWKASSPCYFTASLPSSSMAI